MEILVIHNISLEYDALIGCFFENCFVRSISNQSEHQIRDSW